MSGVRFGALLVIGAGLGLSACGSSEFETRVTAWCESSGLAKQFECGCVASTLSGDLGSEDKEIFLKARVAGSGSAADVERAVKEISGIDPKTDNEKYRARRKAFLDAENAAEDKIKEACKPS